MNIPLRYASKNFGTSAVPIYPRLPCMSWGFGHSPMCRDKQYVILAFAWGPLTQLLVFRDLQQEEEETNIILEGYYFTAPGELSTGEIADPTKLDVHIESLHWLDQSLLVATTNN